MVTAVESESFLVNKLSCNVTLALTVYKWSLKVHEAKQFNSSLSPHLLPAESGYYFSFLDYFSTF